MSMPQTSTHCRKYNDFCPIAQLIKNSKVVQSNSGLDSQKTQVLLFQDRSTFLRESLLKPDSTVWCPF